MNVGIEAWNAAGVLILDADLPCGRIKGNVYVSGTAGSVSADLSDGTPFWSFQPDQMFVHISNQTPPPIFAIGSTGVSWTYSSTAGMGHPNPLKGWLIYGVI